MIDLTNFGNRRGVVILTSQELRRLKDHLMKIQVNQKCSKDNMEACKRKDMDKRELDYAIKESDDMEKHIEAIWDILR